MSSSSHNSPQRNRNNKKIFLFIPILFFGGLSLLYLDRVKRIANHQKIQTFWNEYGTINIEDINSEEEEYSFLPIKFRKSFSEIQGNLSEFIDVIKSNPVENNSDCKPVISDYKQLKPT